MTHFRVFPRKRWPRVDNHLDARRCPYCGLSAHGTSGQDRHQIWHEELHEWMQEVTGRLRETGRRSLRTAAPGGLDEAAVDEPPWTAALGGFDATPADEETENG